MNNSVKIINELRKCVETSGSKNSYYEYHVWFRGIFLGYIVRKSDGKYTAYFDNFDDGVFRHKSSYMGAISCFLNPAKRVLTEFWWKKDPVKIKKWGHNSKKTIIKRIIDMVIGK